MKCNRANRLVVLRNWAVAHLRGNTACEGIPVLLKPLGDDVTCILPYYTPCDFITLKMHFPGSNIGIETIPWVIGKKIPAFLTALLVYLLGWLLNVSWCKSRYQKLGSTLTPTSAPLWDGCTSTARFRTLQSYCFKILLKNLAKWFCNYHVCLVSVFQHGDCV